MLFCTALLFQTRVLNFLSRLFCCSGLNSGQFHRILVSAPVVLWSASVFCRLRLGFQGSECLRKPGLVLMLAGIPKLGSLISWQKEGWEATHLKWELWISALSTELCWGLPREKWGGPHSGWSQVLVISATSFLPTAMDFPNYSISLTWMLSQCRGTRGRQMLEQAGLERFRRRT